MADDPLDQSVDLTTKWGGLRLAGKDSILIFLFLMMLVLGGLLLWFKAAHTTEMEQLNCAIKLNLFMQTVPKGAAIEWDKVPVDLYGCIPRFLYERNPRN